jgi:hypothetical protein
MIENRDLEDIAENSDPADAIEKTEKNEPTDPIEKADPTEPMDRNEPRDPMDKTESCDQSDHRDGGLGEWAGAFFIGRWPFYAGGIVPAARPGKTLPTFDTMYSP